METKLRVFLMQIASGMRPEYLLPDGRPMAFRAREMHKIVSKAVPQLSKIAVGKKIRGYAELEGYQNFGGKVRVYFQGCDEILARKIVRLKKRLLFAGIPKIVK